MTNVCLLASSASAFVLALLGLWKPLDRWVQRVYVWVPLAALAIGLHSLQSGLMSVSESSLLLLGARIGLDPLGRAFLILSATLWLIAGLFARRHFVADAQRRFRVYFLFTYSGTIGLTMAQDVATFYAGYAMMTLSGYGLITHLASQGALMAGRIYILMGLIGEMLILSALIMATVAGGGLGFEAVRFGALHSPVSLWIYTLIFLGFGIKVGLVPLHFWLPRSYYFAPIPAVAVLSGVMTKAGLLGWLRLMPLENFSSPALGAVVLGAGILMVFYGVGVGLVQSRPKTTLAFSSLSQMGYLTIALGAGLEPGAALGPTLTACVIYAYHHAFHKVSLFLGLDLYLRPERGALSRKFLLAGLGMGALALMGFPFTSGAYAKVLLKDVGSDSGLWHALKGPLLVAGAIGTTLLMLRFLLLCWRAPLDPTPRSGGVWAWGVVLLASMSGAWLLPVLGSRWGFETPDALGLHESLRAYAPVALGSMLALWLGLRIWAKDSPFTPRPFDGLLNRLHQRLIVEMPLEMEKSLRQFYWRLLRLRASLRLHRRGKRLVQFSSGLHTDWWTGSVMFLVLGLLFWIVMAGTSS